MTANEKAYPANVKNCHSIEQENAMSYYSGDYERLNKCTRLAESIIDRQFQRLN